MDWAELENQFDRFHESHKLDAKWCIDPACRSRKGWELEGPESFQVASTLSQEFTHAGRLLKRASKDLQGILPAKLLAEDTLSAEAWLNALRHLRINLEQDGQSRGLRRGEVRIREVAHASVQLCARMRVQPSKAVGSERDDVKVKRGSSLQTLFPDTDA